MRNDLISYPFSSTHPFLQMSLIYILMAFPMLMRSYFFCTCLLLNNQTNFEQFRHWYTIPRSLTALDITTTGISILQRTANYSYSLHFIFRLLYLGVVWIGRRCLQTPIVVVFFFFLSRSYCLLETKFTVYEQCIHCSRTVYILFTYLKILKMGLWYYSHI